MIGFLNAISLFYRRYFDFQGRSSRAEYWWIQLLFWMSLVAYFVMVMIIMALAGELNPEPLPDGSDPEISEGLSLLIGFSAIFYALFMIGSIIPSIALTVRRFHDRNLSGWLYLPLFIGLFIPLIGIAAMIAMIVIFAQEGTAGPNQYGPDPLGRHSADTFD